MKIGIIGSGIVGRVLATAFLKEGYIVTLGTRDVNKEEVVKWKHENPDGNVALFDTAASFANIIIIAVKGTVAEEAIVLAGKENFTNKIVIDATNPIANAAPINGVLQYFTNPNESLMERIQALIPLAHVVKAFNSVGNAFMYRPNFNGQIPTMFICGNNQQAKNTVTELLINHFGWEVEDMGMAASARAIEPLCMLWCIPGIAKGQWTHAFKLLKK